MKQANNILEVKDIRKDFSGLDVLTGVDFTVKKNERHAIIGPNGAGKTTLFNIITGNYKSSAGRIIFKDTDVTKKPPYILSRMGMARSFQITNVFPEMSVFENIRAGVRSLHGLQHNFFKRSGSIPEINKETEKILEKVGLTDVMNETVSALSYGRQRALEIGITLSTKPDLILLDEPTAGMTREETIDAIKMINEVTTGRSLVIIEHDMDVVFSLADTVSVLHYGTILASDKPTEIRNNQKVKDAYLGEG
ncbi:ABC transporter ATP-binding protein [uncultured Desulfosarcina sp.]|uniref:ABC transporter ATP-binding protein n=1 Tax=uncultured Desulfosarcina sp. TaxID=218289 RepID=UPI0029C93806|nr:ABC transporter ATP-binding protein [uncultured Desulfosarcina sp.]